MGRCQSCLRQGRDSLVQDRERGEEAVRRLVEVTGATPDACLALLVASRGRVDAAAEQFLGKSLALSAALLRL